MIFQFAFLVLAFIFAIAMFGAIQRRKEFSFTLTPNQLLTRQPLVFLSGDRSVFYFTRYWNQIPSFLTEHGFEVYKAPLPWKRSPERKRCLEHLFASWAKQNFRCHVFVDKSLSQELKDVLQSSPSANVISVTVIGEDLTWRARQKAPLYWRAHQFLTRTPTEFGDLGYGLSEELRADLLNHVKELAEHDFTMPN